MGKHYCDYCDVFLTHDSTSVRKAHNQGRNHLQNVRDYYASIPPAETQEILDTVTKDYEAHGMRPPLELTAPVSGFGMPVNLMRAMVPPPPIFRPGQGIIVPPPGVPPPDFSKPPPSLAVPPGLPPPDISRPPPSLVVPPGVPPPNIARPPPNMAPPPQNMN